MKTRVTWLEDMTYVAQSPSGHAVVMDGPPELGGHNLGPRPMEMLLMGMGGCSAFDVVHILRKGRPAGHRLRRRLSGPPGRQRSQGLHHHPRSFHRDGQSLSAKHVERAVKLSAEKYCSASIMLGKTAQITHTFEIRDA